MVSRIVGPMATTDETMTPMPTDESQARRPLDWWIWVAIGIGSAIIGWLPWLITGMRLPLQNLWAIEATPESMPIVLLPFSQYAITLLFGLIVTGSAVAGVSARATKHRQPRRGTWWIVLGLLLAQILAVVQTATAVIGGLQRSGAARLYISAILGAVLLSILIGALVFGLIARAPRAAATIGISVAAIAAGIWLGELLHPLIDFTNGNGMWLLTVLRWVPPVIVGVGLAWGGLNTVGKVLAGVASLAILWLLPAAVTAVDNAAGSRVLAHDLGQMLAYGANVFVAALSLPELVIPPLLIAIIIGIGGAVLGPLVRRRRVPVSSAEIPPRAEEP